MKNGSAFEMVSTIFLDTKLYFDQIILVCFPLENVCAWIHFLCLASIQFSLFRNHSDILWHIMIVCFISHSYWTNRKLFNTFVDVNWWMYSIIIHFIPLFSVCNQFYLSSCFTMTLPEKWNEKLIQFELLALCCGLSIVVRCNIEWAGISSRNEKGNALHVYTLWLRKRLLKDSFTKQKLP